MNALGPVPTVTLGSEAAGVASVVQSLVEDRVATRLFAQDPNLWGPKAVAEASIRLGWVDVHTRMQAVVAEAAELGRALREDGVDRVVVCGMGGSSLAPEVIARKYAVPLTVLDSTHPAEVRRALSGDPRRTAIVVSSKSGSTIETRSHLAAFQARFLEVGVDPRARVIIVTDPGSSLEAAARDAGYRVFLADSHIGGRYSALSAFGLVPIAVAGADPQPLLNEARDAAAILNADAPENPALRLAAGLAEALPRRATVALAEAEHSGLGDWIEQLVAESTGKAGQGVLPLALAPAAPELRGSLPETALLVALGAAAPDAASTAPWEDLARSAEISVSAGLGAQFLLWETATAILCRLIGVNPFDQPDVESAKVAAREALAERAMQDPPLTTWPAGGETLVLTAPESAPEDLREALQQLVSAIPADGYLALQVYLDRGTTTVLVEELRALLAERLPVPVTLGWGPRFLHSTGQFHKGGPPSGAFLQLTDRGQQDLPIPGETSTFGTLIAAQARGDREVLVRRGRPVLALNAERPEECLRALRDAVEFA